MTAATPTLSVTFRAPLHILDRIDAHQTRIGLSRTAVLLLALGHGLDQMDARHAHPASSPQETRNV